MQRWQLSYGAFSSPRWRAIAGAAAAGCVGCGGPLYAVHITQASAEVARAEQLDAAHRAPYEYHYAVEHLRKARSEAVEADYADAVRLAKTAFHYASRAIQRAQRVEPVVMPSVRPSAQ